MRGLYIHIPFCARKCPYCDFNSYVGKLDIAENYIKRLLKEAKDFSGQKIDTVYIGGGTPSLLEKELIEKLMDGVYDCFYINENAEITIEVNPGTVDFLKLKTYIKSGINRLSVGVQSFDDDMLKVLGRLHDSEQAQNVIKSAFDAGFDNISADLMFSYKGQTMEIWSKDLEKIRELNIPHVSCYGLKVEEGTPFDKNGMQNLDEETDRQLQKYTVSFLNNCGFNRYEISNFAKPGFESRHNIHYWHCDEYIGLGAGAHSYYKGKRYNNILSPEEYINCEKPCENVTELSKYDKKIEQIIMGMRLCEGVEETLIENKTMLEKYVKLGYIVRDKGRIAFTDSGFDISNYILSDFI